MVNLISHTRFLGSIERTSLLGMRLAALQRWSRTSQSSEISTIELRSLCNAYWVLFLGYFRVRLLQREGQYCPLKQPARRAVGRN